MRLPLIFILAFLFAVYTAPCAFADSQQDTQAQIDNLQAQIKTMQEQSQKQMEALQAQVQALKQQVTQQVFDKDALLAKVSEMEAQPVQPFSKLPGIYRLRKEEALSEEGKLNISGEIAMQFKEPTKSGVDTSSNIGFRAYELPELFLDANLTDKISFFTEIPLIYEGGATSLEDGWIDFHFPGELAAKGDTGVKLGQFHVPFGWDNDDNEAYVYGGRTSVDNTLVRTQRLDGQRIRERQIGIQGNYALDLAKTLKLSAKDPVKVIGSVGVFNGSGQTGHAQEWDKDETKDVVTRLEAHLLNAAVGGSYWQSPRTRKITTLTNDTAHPRDIRRYGAHFKYPQETPFPAEDISLAGNRWLLWGEWIYSKAYHSYTGAASTKTKGGYLEFDYGITPKLVGFFRTETYDPDTAVDSDIRNAYTLGARWELLSVCQLVVDYERDNFEGATPTDRIAGMFKVFF